MSGPHPLSKPRRLRLPALVCLLLAPGIAFGQGRTIQKIPGPTQPEGEVLDDLPDLERATCEDAVHEIAAAYGPDEIGTWLHDRFPNRAELLDALARLDLRVLNLELRVESLERIVVLPWRRIDGEVVSDCVATVRTRLVFDDPGTGERTVEEPRRAQWRIRFSGGPRRGANP
jgi:hypothetical protein